MRTIKFRAQDIASNKWLYGDLRHHKDDVCIFEQGGNKGEQVKRDTIGQYTGLHDKNGKEIYEGDIIRLVTGYKKNHDGTFVEKAKEITVEYDLASFNICSFALVTDNIEVIGNIHDNPLTPLNP